MLTLHISIKSGVLSFSKKGIRILLGKKEIGFSNKCFSWATTHELNHSTAWFPFVEGELANKWLGAGEKS